MLDEPIDQLIDVIAELEREHPYGVFAQSRAARETGDQLVVEIDVVVESSVHSSWTIVCDGVVEHRLALGMHDTVSEERQHPLLLDYVDRRADLYFKSAAEDPIKAIGQLTKAHREVMEDWRPMQTYLNGAIWTYVLLGKPSGQLASGPMKVLDRYSAALDPVGTYVVDAGSPRYWTEERQWSTGEGLKLLLLTSAQHQGPAEPRASFVIAKDFATTLVD